MIETAFDVAVAGLAQPELEVNTHETTAPFVKELDVKLAPVPALTPFTLQLYNGEVPPFVGVGVNVTLDPEQIVVVLVAIESAGTTFVVTLIVIGAEVAVGVVKQFALEVTTQVIASLLLIEDGVNVGEFVPAFTPFTFH